MELENKWFIFPGFGIPVGKSGLEITTCLLHRVEDQMQNPFEAILLFVTHPRLMRAEILSFLFSLSPWSPDSP